MKNFSLTKIICERRLAIFTLNLGGDIGKFLMSVSNKCNRLLYLIFDFIFSEDGNLKALKCLFEEINCVIRENV